MSTFSQTAMLVSLNVRAYSARKEDKRVSSEVASSHNTSIDAGKYHKSLVAKSAIDPVTKSAGALRMYHYDNTLPWLDDGIRILPALNFKTYKGDMEGLRDAYETAVKDFIDSWPEIISDARIRLNGLFKESDYPSDVSTRFGCHVRFMPIPDSSDFRVDISDLERDTLKNQIANTLTAAQDIAMRDLWERVSTSVGTMASKLGAYRVNADGTKENVFRDTLVSNLRDLCQLLPRLNFTGDPQLEAVRLRIERDLLQVTAEDLRESELTRDKVQRAADKIAADISEFMA